MNGDPAREKPTITPTLSHASEVRTVFGKLRPGDRVRITQRVRVGDQQWTTTLTGTVLNTERRLTGIHTERARDDRVYVDALVLRRDDGETTTVTLDEFTDLERVDG